MNKSTKYKLFKLLNALLAMLLAASVVCVVVASTMTGVLKSQGFWRKSSKHILLKQRNSSPTSLSN